MMKNDLSATKMNNIFYLINAIKCKDKKIRYGALGDIMKLSRSRKIKQKAELLRVLNEKSFSKDWEERYISMYGISRYMWEGGKFEDLENTYKSVIRLVEDEDGRVRVAAFNALEHFRSFFISFVYGGYNHFDEKEVVKLWMHSLFHLWDKTKAASEGKTQYHLMKCVDTLFRPDMECYLNDKQYAKYDEIWEQLQELNELYNEYGMDDDLFKKKQNECLKKWKK